MALIMVWMLAAALGQDAPVRTAPPVLPETPAPTAAAAVAVDWDAPEPANPWAGVDAERRQPTAPEGGRPRFASAAPRAALPPEAFDDPVGYTARACRPQSRPQGEEIEACFDRVEREIREARRVQRPPESRVTCRQESSASSDGTSVGGSFTCGTGDAGARALGERLRGD